MCKKQWFSTNDNLFIKRSRLYAKLSFVQLWILTVYLEPRNLRNLTWNPYLEPRNLPEPLLGTLTRNLGTCWNLYLEPLLRTSEPAGTFTWNPYLEPRNLPEPLLGTLTWNLGTCRNLYLEPLLGTSEPARTWRDDCPRVPQGLVWPGPQSFQLLGKYDPSKYPKQNQETSSARKVQELYRKQSL